VSWELSSDYALLILGSQTIAAEATLTLMPGLVLKSVQFQWIIIDGQLTAEGTVDEPIHFTSHRDDTVGGDSNNDATDTSPATGWWAGIQVRNAGSATLEHCTVSYGGYSDLAGIYKLGTGNLSLRFCTLRQTNGAGLRLTEGFGLFLSEYNRFEDNVDGVRMGLNTSFTDTTSTFTNNSAAQVAADGGVHSSNVTWELSSHYAIYLTNNHTVGVGTTLTLKPGLVVKVRQFIGLFVDGEIIAQGTSGNPISFTDYRDDSVGGDSNNDGDILSPGRGWWRSIQIRDGGSATLEHCMLRYSGYSEGAGVHKLGSSNLAMANCTISSVNGSGLYLASTTGTADILRSRFTDNVNGVRVNGVAQTISLMACQYETNSSYGVLNNNSADVDARGNWWGHASGPFHATLNPDGTGDPVSDGVLFEPWRTSPSMVGILSPLRSGTIVVGDTLRFLGSYLDDPLAGYRWDFGDGRTSSARNPGLLSFPVIGNFEVQFAVLMDGVPDPFPETLTFNVVQDTGNLPDLHLENLIVPPTIGIGQPSTIDYTVMNIGPGTLPPSTWTDRIYLSDDATLDATDLQLGGVAISKTLASGESYQGSLPVTLPPVEEGARHLILSINDDWNVLELHRLNNEKAASVNVLVPKLQVGQVFNGSHGEGRTEQYFSMEASAGKSLLLDFAHDNPNLEVYLRFGELPTRSAYDYRFSGSSVVVPSATAGTWYVLVFGDALAQAGDFSLTFSLVDIAITNVSPSLQDSASPLELNLFGAGFAQPLNVELVASNDTTYSPDSFSIDSFTSMTATFGAGILPPDTYDVRVERNGSEFILADSLQIISGGQPDFYVDITSPSPMGYHGLATIYVEYGNRGNAPMQAPLLVVTALQNERPGALLTLDQTRLSQGFWTSAIPKGFSTSVRLLAGGQQPGVLLPGEKMRVPVYYAGWLKPWDFRYPPFEFKVSALTSDDTRPIDWNVLKATLRPAYIEEDPWTAIWENLTSAVGSTVGDFVTMLSRNAVYLSRLGSEVRDVNMLLNFELTKAKGLLAPLSELTSSADLATHSGQINLWFTRSFPRAIASRHRLGPLGYGWHHPWEVQLEKETDGTVVIFYGSGSERFFQPDSRGNNYFSGKGDGATLNFSSGNYTLTRRDGSKKVFDSAGLFIRSEDRNGNSIQLQYLGGQLSRLTHSNGLFIELRYNASGLLSEIEDSLGRLLQYSYDANKHLSSFTDSNGNRIEYNYSASSSILQKRHALMEIVHPDNVVQAYTYDDFGRLASYDNGLGATSYGYNQGEILETAATGDTTRLSFNHLGMLSRVVDATSGVTSFSYDSALNNTLIRSPDGSSMSIVHDRKGGISKVINQNGDEWTYKTGPFGLATQITTPQGRTRSMEYDSSGNLTKLIYPNGLIETFDYNASGEMLEHVNALGITETTTYDSVGLPLLKSYSDGSSRSFMYDEKNRLVTATNSEGSTELEYDIRGNLIKITYPTNLFIEYEYDALGRLIASSDQNGLTNRYTYNTSGLLESLKDASNVELVRYSYDGVGAVSEKQFSSGARTVYERNGRGQVTLQQTYDPSNSLIAEYAIDFNGAGLPIIYQTPQGVFTYDYDQAGRLRETVFDPISDPVETTAFQRNGDGELEKMIVNSTETQFTSDVLGRYTSVGGSSMDYNALGNVTSRTIEGEQFSYVYDAVGNVVKMQTDDGDYTMRYDALGTPLGLTTPGMTVDYLFDRNGPQRIFGEYASNGDALRTYQHGLELSVVHYDGESYFPEYDPLKGGTILALPTEITAPKGFNIPDSSPSAYLPFDIPWDYADPLIPDPQFYGQVLEGYVTLASESYELGGQAYEWGVNRAGVDRNLGGLIRNPTYSRASGYAGFGLSFGNLGDLNQYLGRATNLRVVVEGAPQWFQRSAEWLGGDGPKNVLGIFGHITNGIKVIDGLSDTWSENRSVDILDVLNPFGSTNRGEAKIRDGLASTALTFLGAAALGTAAAPVATAAGIIAFVSGATGGLQEDFWIWWDDLDVTGERLRGSAMSGSTDPNQKLGISGYGEENYVSGDTVLTYRIDFENHPDATAPAQVVMIRDQLPDEVDWSTFEILSVGFGDIIIPVDSGSSFFETVVEYEYEDAEYDFEVDVHVEIRIENGEIFAIFYSINPETGLPPPVDIGFLPPEPEKDPENTMPGEGRGQGYISYSVLPKSGIPTNTEIRNVATIQFDFSFDIDTNQVDPLDPSKGTDPNKEALVTIDSDVPQAAVEVLPELSFSSFIVSWGGQSASGIRSYDVYYRTDGGPWTLWRTGTAQTSALFAGKSDATYEFYALGRNNVGVGAPYTPAVQAFTLSGINELYLVIELTASEDVKLSWVGSTGYGYQIQTSSDMVNWADVGPLHNSTQAAEVLSYIDEAFDPQTNEFYRIVVSPP